jgi:hypothetical protein
VTPLEIAYRIQLVGLLCALIGLWLAANGLRVVVSGRIDERRRAAKSLVWGVPLLVVGLLLLFGGSWFANQAQR